MPHSSVTAVATFSRTPVLLSRIETLGLHPGVFDASVLFLTGSEAFLHLAKIGLHVVFYVMFFADLVRVEFVFCEAQQFGPLPRVGHDHHCQRRQSVAPCVAQRQS